MIGYNKKTVSIVTDDGQRWNAAPHFLEGAAPRTTSKRATRLNCLLEARRE